MWCAASLLQLQGLLISTINLELNLTQLIIC